MKVRISGKTFDLPESRASSWKLSVRPGGWVIAESASGRKRISYLEVRDKMCASTSGKLWQGDWLKKSYESATSSDASDFELIAQFPGKVRKVLVQDQSEVKVGDSLVLVEAMKMEFVIRAPYSGVVVKLLVKEGQQLSPGDHFLELKAAPQEK